MNTDTVSSETACQVWAETSTGLNREHLKRYASALERDCLLGPYRPLSDAEEDQALLSLYCVDHPHTTIEAFRQLPALSIAGYHHLIRELAGHGLGPQLPRTEKAA